jgi:transcriptional regulator with XRE-family HTH domain
MIGQKRSIVKTFRTRLLELVEKSGGSQSRFAAKAGLDRSTLSQLLSEQAVRLPRAETVAAIGQHHGASIDWLLGLSEAPEFKADIVSQPILEPSSDEVGDLRLAHWHEEARGSKVRYVPSTLPDQLKSEAIIKFETIKLSRGQAKAMSELSLERKAHAAAQMSEIEVCTTRQSVEAFARGEGIWRTLAVKDRKQQLELMISLSEQRYPSYRWFMFDGRERHSSPYTIFGQKRLAFYVGGMYVVFTSSDHIQAFIMHFDDLVRHARVQPNETPTVLKRLLKDIS